MSDFGESYGRNSAVKELPAWKEVLKRRNNIFTGQDKSQKQENGSTLSFLWDTYNQCGMYDRKGRKEKKERQYNLTKIRGKEERF